jgi:hypothetical protein
LGIRLGIELGARVGLDFPGRWTWGYDFGDGVGLGIELSHRVGELTMVGLSGTTLGTTFRDEIKD